MDGYWRRVVDAKEKKEVCLSRSESRLSCSIKVGNYNVMFPFHVVCLRTWYTIKIVYF
jgi:hypothetical protein